MSVRKIIAGLLFSGISLLALSGCAVGPENNNPTQLTSQWVDPAATFEQKTITGLAVGTYTVTEDTNWSWSYSIVGDNNKTATLSGTTPSATVDVTNHYNSHNWLTSIADVINTWISGSAAQKN